jgi:hypothetical protein
VNRINDTPIYHNIFQYIYNNLIKVEKDKLLDSNWQFSKQLFHIEVSAKNTTWIFNTDKICNSVLADFIHRIIDKSLSTKKI